MSAPFPSPTKTWHDNTYVSLSPDLPHLSQNAKTILITGGGSGIGAETARTFAAAGAAYIALLGRRERPLVETKASIETEFPGTKVFTAPTDVTVETEVNEAFRAFVEFTGGRGVDVLIACAAVIGPQGDIEGVQSEPFLESIQKNVKGAMYTGQAFLKYKAEGEETVVVDINSSAAHLNFAPGFAGYTISKWAVFRFWDCLGFESGFSRKGKVRVYHVQPGVVDTDMNREAGGVKAMGFEDHG
ncbi:hypothetical protein BJY00DRAFT_290966 [Aspergillus carlsbadensis]|nr:hypothetical protein BJY00DRAFT_290966 [Aspergillus carlsbadensis]